MHNSIIAKVRQDDRYRSREAYIGQVQEIKQEAARLTGAGLLAPAATAYRAASAVCREAEKYSDAASSAPWSQVWREARAQMNAQAYTLESLAEAARRTRHMQALCTPSPRQRATGTAAQVEPPALGAQSAAPAAPRAADAFDFETASWDETVDQAKRLEAEADAAHAVAVAKQQQAQTLLTYAAHAPRFCESQHRLAQAWVGQASARDASQQGDIAHMRRDAELTILGFGQNIDTESATSLEGESISVISRTHSASSSLLLESYDTIAEADGFSAGA